jgi:hypothetical protein
VQAKQALVAHVAALAIVTSSVLPISCASQKDVIAQAERTEKKAPDFFETTAIAEEGFIYGLPIVMDYAVKYDFFIDKTSSQYKSGFNQLYNEEKVFTYKDTAVVTPNSDTPYSFAAFDLHAEPIVVTLPAIEKRRYYSLQLIDANTYNFGYAGSRAKAGIYGNDAVEATYPMTRTLADGTPLDASKHRYTLTFGAGQYPPVNAFWSVTMYDGKTQLLIKNPINRYLINSPMLAKMKKNAGGGLTLYIQNKSPGKAKEANWLPAPDGPIYLVMRLYWPKTESPSILPPGEGTWKPPAVKQAS